MHVAIESGFTVLFGFLFWRHSMNTERVTDTNGTS